MYEMKLETRDDLQLAMQFSGAKTAVFSKVRDSRKTGRGNPLLARRRFVTMQEIDSALEKLERSAEKK